MASEQLLREAGGCQAEQGRKMCSAEGRSRCEPEIPGKGARRAVGAEFVKVVGHTDSDLVWDLNVYSTIGNSDGF